MNTTRRARAGVVVLVLAMGASAFVACSSAESGGSGLGTPDLDAASARADAAQADAAVASDGSVTLRDAATDAALDASHDAGFDAGVDAGDPFAAWVFPDTPPRSLLTTPLFSAAAPIANGSAVPGTGSEVYELATALFSDYTNKLRTIRMPAGMAAQYNATEVLDFPVGTVITKTFSLPADRRQPSGAARVIETRVLVKRTDRWEAYPYVWNDAQTDATYAPGGRVIDLATIDEAGAPQPVRYLVPSKNQCQECHHVFDEHSDRITPIGPKARNLNWAATPFGGENQLDRLARLGKLQGLPALAARPKAVVALDPASGTLDERARTYLDVNCAHCHRADSTAGATSQLFLNIANTNVFNLGTCKRPGSAGPGVGGDFDIVPGAHAASILWYRMQTIESGKMMPAIGRNLSHVEGAALIASWIDAMPPQSCTTP